MTAANTHPRAAFRISFAAGLLVLAVTLFSVAQEPVRPCGNLPQNYAPIIAFELARSAADLEAIFGTQAPCRSEVVERMDAINLVDMLVCIPAYGMFMAFFFLGMRARHAFALLPWATGIKWLGLGAAAAIAAAIHVKSSSARLWNYLAALVCAAAFVSTVAAMALPAMFGPRVGLGVAVSWLAYLCTAGAAAFRPVPGAAELRGAG